MKRVLSRLSPRLRSDLGIASEDAGDLAHRAI